MRSCMSRESSDAVATIMRVLGDVLTHAWSCALRNCCACRTRRCAAAMRVGGIRKPPPKIHMAVTPWPFHPPGFAPH